MEEILQLVQEPETRLGINEETAPIKPENDKDFEAKMRKEPIVLTANGTRTAVRKIQDLSHSPKQLIPINSQINSKNLPVRGLNRSSQRNLRRSLAQ